MKRRRVIEMMRADAAGRGSMRAEPGVVEATRGGVVESVHRVHAVVVDATGTQLASAGDADLLVHARSSVKAVQAMPLVEDGVADALGWGTEELALACASHSGTLRHVEIARRMLDSIGLGADALACGAHWPMAREAARELRGAGGRPSRLHNNCSGKHAGMLAVALHHGWEPDGYHLLEHPVQQRALAGMARWSGEAVSSIATGVDGCGVVTFGVPLVALARTFAALNRAAGAGERAPMQIVGAMTKHPDLVAGEGRLCTELMRATAGRVFLKVGAEGVYAAACRQTGRAVALKVEDGAMRAVEPAAVAVLLAAGLLGQAEAERLQPLARPPITNTRDEPVGELRARVDLRQGVP